LYEQGNTDDAKGILQSILSRVRTGMKIQPDFKLRLLMALSSNESRDGNHEAALSYLEQIRGLADDLDDRRRAHFLCDLAYSYTETGDYEAAIRTGYASLALFKAADTSFEIARLENELALAHLHSGNIARAEELSNDAERRFAELRDERQRAHVLDVQAQIAIAREDWDSALTAAQSALDVAKSSENPYGVADARLSLARAQAGRARTTKSRPADKMARDAFDAAAAEARSQNRPQVLRRVLTEYADFLAASGDHKAAFELSREALASSR
jgi:tetratricopeptide (TPR) repeat protein